MSLSQSEATVATQTRLFTRQRAAVYLAVSVRKVDQLTACGDLPRVTFGRAIRFTKDDLDKLIEERRGS